MITRFRAWDDWRKRMSIVDRIYIDTKGVRLYDDFGEYWRDFRDVILMQSTGLFDKNGQEIFEGDIVIDYQGTFFEVKRAEGYAGFFLYPYDPEDFMTFYPGIELTIIGNIYEDPGLMEV